METKKADKVKVAFTREEINGVGIVLRTYMKTCMDTNAGKEALNFYKKIMKYGRPYIHNNVEYVAVYFFKSEFANLMRIISLYAYAGSEDNEEFYNKIGQYETDVNILNAIKLIDQSV